MKLKEMEKMTNFNWKNSQVIHFMKRELRNTLNSSYCNHTQSFALLNDFCVGKDINNIHFTVSQTTDVYRKEIIRRI